MSEREKWEDLLKQFRSLIAVTDKEKRAKEFLVKNLRKEITKQYGKK